MRAIFYIKAINFLEKENKLKNEYILEFIFAQFWLNQKFMPYIESYTCLQQTVCFLKQLEQKLMPIIEKKYVL